MFINLRNKNILLRFKEEFIKFQFRYEVKMIPTNNISDMLGRESFFNVPFNNFTFTACIFNIPGTLIRRSMSAITKKYFIFVQDEIHDKIKTMDQYQIQRA